MTVPAGVRRTGSGACNLRSTGQAGEYPDRPIRLIVPLTAGADRHSRRIIAVPLSEQLGQQVIVDNRPGAGGNIGADIAAKSPPDGYTLFMGTSGPLAINSSLYAKLPFDPMKDFAPVILAASAPFVVIVHPSVAASNMKELIALAKAKPGQLNYGSVPGSASHLSTELFKMLAGVNIAHIPYKGAAQATDRRHRRADSAQLRVDTGLGILRQSRQGQSARRDEREADCEAAGPADRRRIVVAGLRRERMVRRRWRPRARRARSCSGSTRRSHASSASPAQRERMLAADFEPTTSTPEQFAAFIKSETAKWGKVVKASGAKPE
jgi:tripartite-type tricarboxylate transporter receptor subunit TctC